MRVVIYSANKAHTIVFYACHIRVEKLDKYRTMWRHEYIQLPHNQRLFVFEVKRGGTENVDDLGDICVDDIKVEAEECREFFAL